MENGRNGNGENKLLAEEIRRIIIIESEKPDDERDLDLIEECVNFLMEIEGRKALTKEQIEDAKRKVFASAEANNVISISKPKRTRSFKAFWAAACIALAVLIANLTAVACGVDTAAILCQFGTRLVEMFAGEREDFKGVTIVKDNEVVEYTDVESFYKGENLNVLYPYELPKNLSISKILIETPIDSKNIKYKKISFITENSKVGLTIFTNPNIQNDFLTNKDCNLQIINGFDCYIFSIDNNYTQCDFVYNGCVYRIKGITYDDIVTIVNNLKEFDEK